MKKEREPSYSPLRGWGSPSILPLVNIHYGSYSTAGFDSRATSNNLDRRSVDTVLTTSDRFSGAVTSPPRGGIVDPVVVNAGFTFRLTEPKATYIHNHVHVDPASAVTKTASSYLSKEIDKFLKKSDHSLDRFQKLWKGKTPPPKEISSIERGTSVSKGISHQETTPPYIKAPLKPPRLFHTDKTVPPEQGFVSTLENEQKLHTQDPSFLSYTKPSIAEQAERHRQILSRVLKSAGVGEAKGKEDDSETLRQRSSISSSSSASSDDLDGTFEDAVVFNGNPLQEKSDDTSAEISKLEDLSSGSDDEFFDVHPLPGYFHIPGRQQIRPTGVVQAPLMPVGSISGPSIPNRFPIHSYSLPAVNKLHPSTRMGNKQPMTNTSSQGLRGAKKYPAPPPPVSREASLLSLSSETNRSSLDESTMNISVDSSSLNGDVSLENIKKKIRRNHSFKKYPAPQPPMPGDSQKTPVNRGDISTFPSKKDSVITTSDTKVPLENLSKPSPDSIRKLGTKRPGSPVPFRSALFPLGKSSSTNISNGNADINLSGTHNTKTKISSKYNNTQTSNSASSTPYNTSENVVSSENTSNSKCNKSVLSGSKELSSNVNVSSIISSSDKTESSVSHQSDDMSSAQDFTSICSSVAVSSQQSSYSASTKAFNSASSTVLSADIASTSVEYQDSNKKTITENQNSLNAASPLPLERKLDKEILTNGGLENEDKSQPNKMEGLSSGNPSSDIGSKSPSIKQEDSKATEDSTKSNSTTHDSKEIETTTDPKEKDMSLDNTKSESMATDSKQSEVATDSTKQDKTTKKVKKKKVSSDKNSSNKDDERRSRSSSVTSSRSVTPDKGLRSVPRKSISGKLAALTTKFELDESAEKNQNSISKKTLGSGLFSSDKSESKGKVIGKLSSPYSKPFSPESTIKEKKSNIGGIDISMFGGLGKPKKPGKKDEEKDDKEKKIESTDKKEKKKHKKEEEKDDKVVLNKDSKIESTKQDIVTEDTKKISDDKQEVRDKEKSKPNKSVNENYKKEDLIKTSSENTELDLEIGKNETIEILSSKSVKDENLNKSNSEARKEIPSDDQSCTLNESNQHQSSMTNASEGTKVDETSSPDISVKKVYEIVKDNNRNQTEDFTNQKPELESLEVKNSYEKSVEEKNEKIEEKLDDQNNSLIKKKDENEISESISSGIVSSEEKRYEELSVEGEEIKPSDVLPTEDIDKPSAETISLDIDQSNKVIETESQQLNIMPNINGSDVKSSNDLDHVEKLNLTKSAEQESNISINNTSQNELTLEIPNSKTSENLIIQPDLASNKIEAEIQQLNIVKNIIESDTTSPSDLNHIEKPNFTNSTEQELNHSISILSQNELTPEITQNEIVEGLNLQNENPSNKKENSISPIEQSTVNVNNFEIETPVVNHIQHSIETVKSQSILQQSTSSKSESIETKSESISQESIATKSESIETKSESIPQESIATKSESIETMKSESIPQESIATKSESIETMKSESTYQESTSKPEIQSPPVLKPAEETENTELSPLPQTQILSEKSENDSSFSTYRPCALTPIPEVSLPGSPVLHARDISAAVTDSIDVEKGNKALPGNSGEYNEFTPIVDQLGTAKDMTKDDNCKFTFPKVLIDVTETSNETFGKFEDSCSTGSFGTPPSDRASSDELFIYEPRILSDCNAESMNQTSHNDIEHSKGVTPAMNEMEAPPLSIPYVKQFIDMSRSPSEMIHPSNWMPQKSTSLLQKVSDLFQNLVSKENKGNPPSLATPVLQVTHDPVSINDLEKVEMERKPVTLKTDISIPSTVHVSNETPLYSYARGEETQTFQPETSKVEGLAHHNQHQLSVRPKIRRTARGSSIPAEVLNVSEILREADERLSRALSKSASSLNSDLERLRNDSPTHPVSYDPSRFDTLMPLPNADEINMVDKSRSRSMTPFMDRFERSPTPKRVMEETEALLTETDRILRKTRSQHSLRRSFAKSLSGANLNRLTEVTADLSEEHSTAHLASERIEAEQSERMRLEEEVSQLQMEVKRMTSLNDKLEMEKLTLRSEVLQHVEVNGDIVGDDEEGTSDASLYKRKYEWAMREIEVLKKQLKQQQEDDLDQLLVLKKQLEKKVTDAYEETDEQRQVVAQMKKKSQRLQAEMNDMKILLEEQTSRNNLLEKKQRKFDQEMQSVVEEQRNERLAKEKIQRERDQILSEKYSFEQEVSTLKLELEMKEEKIAVLARELSDLNFTGKAEEEVALLKKAKHDLELKVKDQEEELDDLAGQVQMLEAARIRLEMSIEQTRKENRRELGQRDEEMEEVRVSAQKKIKALEAQLESEHDERTALVREKHDLERRLVDAHSRSFASVDEEAFHRVKKELKKTKALLKDTQTMLEKTQSEGSNKLLMRQLKTQLEDAEFAKNAAIKARQSAESDFSELQSQLEEALRAKKDTEDKLARVTKEKSEVQTQLEESEEEVAEVMKKYKATVSQLSVDQVNMSEQAQLIADLEHDKQVLQDRLTELSSKVEVLEGETANIHTQRRLQMKIKELESKLDLELTTRQRLESQITRLKDQVEKVSSECDSIRLKEMQAMDHGKKLGRQLREAKEDASNLQQKLTDSTSRKQEIEKQYELAESEIMTLKSDLKLAFKRIEDLQQALQGDLSDSDTEMSESGSESDLSLTSFLTASASTSRSSERTSSATTTAAAAVAAPNTEQVPQETPLTGKDPDSTSHDLRIRDVVVGGASLMTSIREEGGKESYA